MIDALYEASQAGVEIDLIVRGICCLRPGVPGPVGATSGCARSSAATSSTRASTASPTAPADGGPAYYIGSADLMPRNLDRRVEALAPVDDPDLQAAPARGPRRRAWPTTCWPGCSDADGAWRHGPEGEPSGGGHPSASCRRRLGAAVRHERTTHCPKGFRTRSVACGTRPVGRSAKAPIAVREAIAACQRRPGWSRVRRGAWRRALDSGVDGVNPYGTRAMSEVDVRAPVVSCGSRGQRGRVEVRARPPPALRRLDVPQGQARPGGVL